MMNRNASEFVSFYQFVQLPFEIRRIIWILCLPSRLLENKPADYEGDYVSAQSCNSWTATVRNAHKPVIALVCHEAAQVTEEMGRRAVPTATNNLDSPLWVQADRDIAFHKNDRTDDGQNQFIFTLHTKPLFRTTRRLKLYPSITSQYLVPFPLRTKWKPGPVRLRTGVSGHHQESAVAELVEEVPTKHGDGTLIVQLVSLTIHLSPETARRSGLFGLLGDAPIQSIDVDDVPRIRAFHHLVNQHGPVEESKELLAILQDMLDQELFLDRVGEWRAKAEWQLLAHMWLLEKMKLSEGRCRFSQAVLYAAWSDGCSDDELKHFEHKFDEANEWVIEARGKMWQLKPQIMIRTCSNTCYRIPVRGHNGHIHN